MTSSHLDLPIDETSRARLAEQGLDLRVVDTSDAAEHTAWSDAVNRGFLGPAAPAEQTEARRAHVQHDRLVGVYDPTAAVPAEPVATTHCWPAELTLPGARTVTSWAISGVTVSQTHRRRGIARALIEAELRTAVSLGLPIAMLTVSESTIYARFGFSPAALARNLTVSTRRVRWTGPEPTGRVHHVTPEQLRDQGHPIVERVRATLPGDVGYAATSNFWLRQIGLGIGDDNAKNLRLVRYDDIAGTPQGFAVYQLVEDEADFSNHTLKLHTLVAATTDAYAGLWRFVLEMDLVATVTAHLRPVDEPLRWMIDDFRAVHVDEVDHLWVRVLDVATSLRSRTYAAPGRVVLRVDDPLGLAAGTFALDVDAAGQATVAVTDDAPDATVTVNALGSLLLGGVSARTLTAAGSVSGDAERLDEMFRSPVEPFLSTWF
ncbi:GNAT family N-acetyltransferase [Aeromicrobium endophyticum]|uniref:GNAT family N-acetyltransferase n=1 Tax=Aeromicrobium endophyticum TaxID=2292704 RepID=A0A371P7Y3_9ACTN|nr:GNAT family N-acetyltransferase [Aeromicrobium endophyticum]REK72084.1 GNAT family N-acetyltransferase [Aeromicrobium endophyticum]